MDNQEFRNRCCGDLVYLPGYLIDVFLSPALLFLLPNRCFVEEKVIDQLRLNMNQNDINLEELQSFFTVIGLSNQEGIQNRHRLCKHRQVFDYLVHIEKAVNSLSRKKTLTIVDCACGRSYLSFVTNYYLLHELQRKVEFVCIDYNAHVIEKSINAAHRLGFTNMSFICDDISRVRLNRKADIVYSLHACNTATDMTIAKGILEQANYIMSVSCCQHFVKSRIKKHPLTSITRHGVYKERIVDMVADTMRSLLLEEAGYETDLFEYVPASETPKNIMIRAKKGSNNEKRSAQARNEYIQLKELFNIEPKLGEYLNEVEKRSRYGRPAEKSSSGRGRQVCRAGCQEGLA